ncbi:MAG: hypothetical protein GY928_02390 [Colwellia sp.]|nr:hypothetical protein [Colwellia sp.]
MRIHRNIIAVKMRIISGRKEERNPILALNHKTGHRFASVSLVTSAKRTVFKA